MATPLGHMLAGAAVGSVSDRPGPTRARLLVGALAGGAADLDFIPGVLIGDPGRYHHAFSHSLTFALLAAVLVGLSFASRRISWAGLAGGAYVSHLVLDYLTFDPSPPQGIPWFWPLSDAYFSASPSLLPRVIHSSMSIFNLHNVLVAGMELLVFGGLLTFVLWWRHGRPFPSLGGGTRGNDR